MSQEVALIPDVDKLRSFLAKRHDAAIADLDNIKTISTDEDYEAAESILATAKQLYDVMSAKRKQFTDPIKKAIEEIMAYENAINYTSKSDNHYTRAKSLLDEYNQNKLKAKEAAEHAAWLQSELIKYKAEFKAKVQMQLLDMISGMERTVIDNMVTWESNLTLVNISANEEKLRNSNPTLKQEKYDACFRRWGAKPMIMGPDFEDEYLAELKKELPFDFYNTMFQKVVAPVKNKYLARIPEIKANLETIEAADGRAKAKLLAQQNLDREAKKQADLKAAADAKLKQEQAINDQKDIGKMEGDFTAQAMTADLESGPSKKVASFSDDTMWLAPFLKVVGKVATSPKFKGILNKDGEYVPEVDKWMKAYSQFVGEPLDGITFEVKAKTIVRRSKT